MKPKLTILLLCTFLLLFSGSVYSDEPEVIREFYDNGMLEKETLRKNGKQDRLDTSWYENGEKEVLKTLWFESGEKKDVEIEFWAQRAMSAVKFITIIMGKKKE